MFWGVNSRMVAGLKVVEGSESGWVFGVAVPLFIERGVNGAALAACDEIVVARIGTGKVAGVKAGDSTLSDRLLSDGGEIVLFGS